MRTLFGVSLVSLMAGLTVLAVLYANAIRHIEASAAAARLTEPA